MFSQSFLQLLIYGALSATALGTILLLVLLVRDWTRGRLW